MAMRVITREEFVKNAIKDRYDSQKTFSIVKCTYQSLNYICNQMENCIREAENMTSIKPLLDAELWSAIQTMERLTGYKRGIDKFIMVEFHLKETEFDEIVESEAFYPLLMDNINTVMNEIYTMYRSVVHYDVYWPNK